MKREAEVNRHDRCSPATPATYLFVRTYLCARESLHGALAGYLSWSTRRVFLHRHRTSGVFTGIVIRGDWLPGQTTFIRHFSIHAVRLSRFNVDRGNQMKIRRNFLASGGPSVCITGDMEWLWVSDCWRISLKWRELAFEVELGQVLVYASSVRDTAWILICTLVRKYWCTYWSRVKHVK